MSIKANTEKVYKWLFISTLLLFVISLTLNLFLCANRDDLSEKQIRQVADSTSLRFCLEDSQNTRKDCLDGGAPGVEWSSGRDGEMWIAGGTFCFDSRGNELDCATGKSADD